jgi:6-phosphogluconolactonase
VVGDAGAPVTPRVGDVGALGAEALVDALSAAAASREQVVLALSGGTSPNAVLEQLPGRLPAAVLAKLRLTWTDERVVPYGGAWSTWDPLVNRRAAHERWLCHLQSPVLEVPLWEGQGTSVQAAVRYTERWRGELGSRIDVLLLGFGPDGHLASLFPDHPGLDASDVITVVDDAPKPPPVRLSLTLPALRTADRVVGLATGRDKGSVLRRALDGDVRLPLGRYVPRAVVWVVDPPAAEALECT